MTEQSLWVPLGTKAWINANHRYHWRVKAAMTKTWREETGWLAAASLHPMDQAQIICELSFADRQRRDPANWAPTAKACVDGLVDAGILVDDSHHYVTGPDMRIGPVSARHFRGLKLLLLARPPWSP